MLLVFVPKNCPTVVELRWTWLPAFIGTNYGFLTELRHAWEKLPEMERIHQGNITSVELERIHGFAIDWICSELKIKGLREYLESIRNVEEV